MLYHMYYSIFLEWLCVVPLHVNILVWIPSNVYILLNLYNGLLYSNIILANTASDMFVFRIFILSGCS